jgi:hypothetical protein
MFDRDRSRIAASSLGEADIEERVNQPSQFAVAGRAIER